MYLGKRANVRFWPVAASRDRLQLPVSLRGGVVLRSLASTESRDYKGIADGSRFRSSTLQQVVSIGTEPHHAASADSLSQRGATIAYAQLTDF